MPLFPGGHGCCWRGLACLGRTRPECLGQVGQQAASRWILKFSLNWAVILPTHNGDPGQTGQASLFFRRDTWRRLRQARTRSRRCMHMLARNGISQERVTRGARLSLADQQHMPRPTSSSFFSPTTAWQMGCRCGRRHTQGRACIVPHSRRPAGMDRPLPPPLLQQGQPRADELTSRTFESTTQRTHDDNDDETPAEAGRTVYSGVTTTTCSRTFEFSKWIAGGLPRGWETRCPLGGAALGGCFPSACLGRARVIGRDLDPHPPLPLGACRPVLCPEQEEWQCGQC